MKQRYAESGFTSIELLTVLIIMSILATMAVPKVMDMVRAGAVRDSAQQIATAWNHARIRAMRTYPLAGENEHFGLVIYQDNQRAWTGVVKSAQELPDGADVVGGPDARIQLSRSVIVSYTDQVGHEHIGELACAWYASYGNGQPIAPSAVAAGLGATAPAIGIGLGTDVFVSGSIKELRVQSLDFDPDTADGHAYVVKILPVGLASVEEWSNDDD